MKHLLIALALFFATSASAQEASFAPGAAVVTPLSAAIVVTASGVTRVLLSSSTKTIQIMAFNFTLEPGSATNVPLDYGPNRTSP